MQTITRVQDAALSDRERELAAIVSAYNEVTERLKGAHERLSGEVSRLREELRRKNDELMRRERLAALGQMAAGVAHEVRNPLGGIALYASMLEQDLRDRPKARHAATRISHAVRTLDRLVSDILEFAQEFRLERRTQRLEEVLAQVLESLRPWAEQSGAAVEIADGAEQITVHCDGLRMQQVLLNLLMNAVQAAGPGGRARLDARRDPHNNQTVIEIIDNGVGLDERVLDRIFNPFFTTKDTGTGLGLAIVHRIVEAHGGTIRAGNRPEGGARFEVRLPEEEIDPRGMGKT